MSVHVSNVLERFFFYIRIMTANVFVCFFFLGTSPFTVFSTTDLNDENKGGRILKSNSIMLKRKNFLIIGNFCQIRFSFLKMLKPNFVMNFI